MVLHFVKLTMPVLWSVVSLYWNIVTCHYSNIIRALRLFMKECAHPHGRPAVVDSWYAGIDVTSAAFSSNKGGIVNVLEKTAVSRFGVLLWVLSLFYVFLHRSSIAPMRGARCSGRQATFQWSAPCGQVRLGSASPHTAASDCRWVSITPSSSRKNIAVSLRVGMWPFADYWDRDATGETCTLLQCPCARHWVLISCRAESKQNSIAWIVKVSQYCYSCYVAKPGLVRQCRL